MLARTGKHGRGVERRVPEMRRMVEFNRTSTNPVYKVSQVMIGCNQHIVHSMRHSKEKRNI